MSAVGVTGGSSGACGRGPDTSEHHAHLADVGEPRVDRDRRRLRDHGREPSVDRRVDRADIEPLVGRPVDRRRRSFAGRRLVERDAEREDVGRRSEWLAIRLLGRHVVPRAHHHAGRRERVFDLVEATGDAEVGQLRVAMVVEQHVRRA